MILYIIIIVTLFVLMLLYFRIATHFNIIDKPNERSSHTRITLRGGGIIFPIAFLLFMGYEIFFNNYPLYLASNPMPNFWIFGGGLLLICGISFIDDVIDLSSKIRLVFHFLSVTLLLYFLNVFSLFPFWIFLICYIIIVGILNAYNFMDGINGITGLYSLIVLGTLFYVNESVIAFTDRDFIIYPGLACLVFLFFNFRKKAKCFMGDIGSMGIAFWVVALIGLLMMKTGEIKWILFLAVYGVEVVSTILERMKLKENIFEAHRRHLYQLLANDKKVSHLQVSAVYAGIQLVINSVVVFSNLPQILLLAVTSIPLLALYLYTKQKIKKGVEG